MDNVVIVGKKNTGKTYLAIVLAEELMAHNQQTKQLDEKIPVVMFAPSGQWNGIRAGRAGGLRGGYRVLTIGGPEADFMLDPRMGAKIADLVDAVAPTPILVEMVDLSLVEQQEVADFAERLNASLLRRPLHIIIDESEDFFPTSPMRGPQMRCAYALDHLVRKRRARGIAVTMITSRLANLNRNVTSQAGRFFVFSMFAPQDLKAVDELVNHGSVGAHKQDFAWKVARLRQGEAFHVTYGEDFGQVRFRVRRRRTFDAQLVQGKASDKTMELGRISKKIQKMARAILFTPGEAVTATAGSILRQNLESRQVSNNRKKETNNGSAQSS